MTWTAPRNWTTNEVVTASIMDTHIRDNLLALAHPYDYAPSDVDVTNTVTETSIYSKVITGNDLGTNGWMRLNLFCDFLYNNSTANDYTWRLKFGGATHLSENHSYVSTSASRYAVHLPIWITNRGATNSQLIYVGPVSSAGPGEDYRTSAESIATAAIDTTADQTLQVTVQWDAASANLSFRKRVAVLHLGRN